MAGMVYKLSHSSDVIDACTCTCTHTNMYVTFDHTTQVKGFAEGGGAFMIPISTKPNER